MGVTDTVARLGTTVIAIVRTRLELAALELEDQSQRYLGYLLLSLLALFLFGIALILVALFVIVLFWDSYRLTALLGMAGLFGLAAAVIGFKVRASFGAAPKPLSATLAELRKDIDFVTSARQSND